MNDKTYLLFWYPLQNRFLEVATSKSSASTSTWCMISHSSSRASMRHGSRLQPNHSREIIPRLEVLRVITLLSRMTKRFSVVARCDWLNARKRLNKNPTLTLHNKAQTILNPNHGNCTRNHRVGQSQKMTCAQPEVQVAGE